MFLYVANLRVPTDEGWLYCAAHKDLFNGEIVGYALGSRITTELVAQSLFRSLKTRRPDWGLIHHSDRGIIVVTQPEGKLSTISLNTSRSSIIGNGDRHAWGIFPLLPI